MTNVNTCHVIEFCIKNERKDTAHNWNTIEGVYGSREKAIDYMRKIIKDRGLLNKEPEICIKNLWESKKTYVQVEVKGGCFTIMEYDIK